TPSPATTSLGLRRRILELGSLVQKREGPPPRRGDAQVHPTGSRNGRHAGRSTALPKAYRRCAPRRRLSARRTSGRERRLCRPKRLKEPSYKRTFTLRCLEGRCHGQAQLRAGHHVRLDSVSVTDMVSAVVDAEIAGESSSGPGGVYHTDLAK